MERASAFCVPGPLAHSPPALIHMESSSGMLRRATLIEWNMDWMSPRVPPALTFGDGVCCHVNLCLNILHFSTEGYWHLLPLLPRILIFSISISSRSHLICHLFQEASPDSPPRVAPPLLVNLISLCFFFPLRSTYHYL